MTSLAQVRLFQNVPSEALRLLERGAAVIEPRHGAEIFVQGQVADAVYAILGGEGHVRIGSIDRRGKRLMVEVFGAGDIFGEVGVLDNGCRTATACVEGRVRLLRIAAASFLSALEEAPVLGANLAHSLAQRLRRTFALFEDATFETLEVRLARQLLHMARLFGLQTGQGIMLSSRLRQGDLADLLGATTRSIITILNDWRDTGMVIYDSDAARLTICDEAAMRALVEAAA